MVYVTRRERFCAAHRLFRDDWDEVKNEEIYCKCSNEAWHGHNYELFITIKGEINPETGFVMNIKRLSTIIKEKVVEKLDHRNINTQVDFMLNKLASTENLAIGIWEEIEPSISALGIQLHSVKIKETENNFIEYFGN